MGRLALKRTAAKFQFGAARRRILAGAGGALLLSAIRRSFAALARDVCVVDELLRGLIRAQFCNGREECPGIDRLAEEAAVRDRCLDDSHNRLQIATQQDRRHIAPLLAT
jgi:hypothetical protein